jgi:hypothetical protein
MKRSTTAVLVLAAAFLLAGCTRMLWSRHAAPPPEESARTPETPYLQKVGVQRENETPLPTSVESTLILQDKYAKTLEELSREQQRSRSLADDNKKLADGAAKLQADLAKAQQELGEANDLLVQMRQELEKWKADILGFRDELRRADQVQLEAIGKVLTLLGGEVAKGIAFAEKATAAEAPVPPEPKAAAPAEPPLSSPVAAKSAAPAKTTAPAVTATSTAPAAKPARQTKDAPRDATK